MCTRGIHLVGRSSALLFLQRLERIAFELRLFLPNFMQCRAPCGRNFVLTSRLCQSHVFRLEMKRFLEETQTLMLFHLIVESLVLHNNTQTD